MTVAHHDTLRQCFSPVLNGLGTGRPNLIGRVFEGIRRSRQILVVNSVLIGKGHIRHGAALIEPELVSELVGQPVRCVRHDEESDNLATGQFIRHIASDGIPVFTKRQYLVAAR